MMSKTLKTKKNKAIVYGIITSIILLVLFHIVLNIYATKDSFYVDCRDGITFEAGWNAVKYNHYYYLALISIEFVVVAPLSALVFYIWSLVLKAKGKSRQLLDLMVTFFVVMNLSLLGLSLTYFLVANIFPPDWYQTALDFCTYLYQNYP